MAVELEIQCQNADDWAALEHALGKAGLETVRPALKTPLLEMVVLLGSVGAFTALVRALEAFLKPRINRSITLKYGNWQAVVHGSYRRAEIEDTIAAVRSAVADMPSGA